MTAARRFVLCVVPVAALGCPVTLSAARPASGFRIVGDAQITREAALRAMERYDISLDPPIDYPTADDAAFYLRESLFREGFPNARVEYEFQDETVIFQILEGGQYSVGTIDFEGGEGLSDDRRRAVFQAALRQATLTPFGRPRYVRRAIDAAAGELTRAYQDAGFINADVQSETAFQGSLADILVIIDQRPQAFIKEIVVVGEPLPEAPVKAARKSEGETYFPGSENLIRTALLGDLRALGYFDADVASSAIIDEEGEVVIRIEAAAGRLFNLGSIQVEGHQRSRLTAILGRLGLPKGKPYNARAVDEAVRRLWFTGAFEDVDVSPEKSGPDTIDLHLKVKEGRARQISGTVGYGQWEQGFASVTYTDRNFLGTLNRLYITGLVSTRTYGLVAGLSDPFLFRTNVTATLSGLAMRRETPAYRSTFYGVNLAVERRFDEPSATAWRLGLTWRATSNTTVFSDEGPGGADANYRLGQVSFGQTLDRRNNPLAPMQGYFLSWDTAVASEALLGNLSFAKIEAQATTYIPLREIVPERPFVPFLAFNHRAALIAPYGNTKEIPVQERFFLGGPDSVRSFLYDGMAPRDRRGNPSGGLLSLLANAEIQVPLWNALYGVAFVDAGNLAPTLDTFDWDDTRIAIGLGARLYTPLGAVRIDYGANMIRGPGDPIGAWQFGFGFTF